MLNSAVTEMGTYTCLSLEGRIDGITSSDIERQMKDLMLRGRRNLIVDFERINYISSAGLRVLLMVQKQLKQAGGEIVLAALPAAVKEVFRVSGFSQMFRIAESKDAAAALQSADTPAIATTHTVIDNIDIVHHRNPGTPPAALLSIGDSDKMIRAEYGEGDVVSVSSYEISFGAGLATVGDVFSDYKDFFGEGVVINRHIFFYPAAKKPAVDFMLQSDEQFELQYRFFHGFGFRVPFSHIVAFETRGPAVELSRLGPALLSLTGAAAAGIVLLAESKGIWGMHLKQVPTADRKPADDGEIFAGSNFPQWMNFPVEPCDVDSVVAAAGIVARRDATLNPQLKKVLGGDEFEHFHACIFQKDILSKKPEHFEDELRRVISNLAPLKVQHLLGQSAFGSGLAGIVELSDIVETKV